MKGVAAGVEEVPNRAAARIDDVMGAALQVMLRVAGQHAREVRALLDEFREELDRGVDVDDFVHHAENVEREFHLDVWLVRERLRRALEGIDPRDLEGLTAALLERVEPPDPATALDLVVNLPPLLVRAGCRAGRRDAVLLGEALAYAYGGFLKYAICAALAAVALSAGKEHVAREVWQRCLHEDLELRLRACCAAAEFVERHGLDLILPGLSGDIEEMRRTERGE
jgi:hypothetical protein